MSRPDPTHVSFLADPSDAPKVLIRGADPTLAVKPEAVDLVFYHGSSCPDGFAAAYAAYTARGSAAQYVPVEHPLDEAALPDVAGRHVVAVDYAFPKAVCERMIARAASFLILDHHASAEKELVQTAPALPARHACFDMKMSGATMAWSFFHPGEEVPLFFRYLEDRDIWRWAFRGSREVCDALSATVPNTFEALEALRGKGAAGIEELMAAGASITKYKETVIDSHVKRAVTGTLKAAPQFKCRFVNGSTLASEIGNVLCERAENKDETVAAIFCACWARSAAAPALVPPLSPNACARPYPQLSRPDVLRSLRPREAPLLRVAALRERRGGRVRHLQGAGRRGPQARGRLHLRAAGGRARVCRRRARGCARRGRGREARKGRVNLSLKTNR